MNAINRLELNIPMPAIATVDAVDHLTVQVTWSQGLRKNRTDVVDLSPMINTLRHYRPLRDDIALFRSIHLIEDGRIIAWGEAEEIDMAADSVEDLAEETMTPDDLRKFLSANALTQGEAAALLDRSRRQIANYLSGSEPIPRGFVLSCFGLVARKKFLRGPITKPYENVPIQPIQATSAGSNPRQLSFTQVPQGATPTTTDLLSAE